jgi:hypothetical protein
MVSNFRFLMYVSVNFLNRRPAGAGGEAINTAIASGTLLKCGDFGTARPVLT